MRKLLFRLLVVLTAGLFGLGFWLYQPDLPLDYLEKKYAGPDSRFTHVQGMRVHYRDQGQGPVLVLLHGTAASLHTWDGWVEALASDFRVVRMDLPARSDAPGGPADVTVCDERITVRWEHARRRVAPGQSVVLYDETNTRVLGGGVAE